MLAKRMLSLQTISKSITPYSGITRHQLHTSIKWLSASSSESSDSSGSDSDKESTKSKLKQELAEDLKRRGNIDVLSGLISDLSKKTASSKIDVAIPKKPPRPIKKESEVTEESQFEAKLTSAAKTVAEKIGGDVKKTEIDLLDRLLKNKIESGVDEKPDTVASSEPSSNLSDILKGCKIDRTVEINREVDIQKEKINRIRTTTRKVDNFQVRANDEGSILHDLLRQKKRAEFLRKKDQSSESEGFNEVERQTSRSRFRETKPQQTSFEASQKGFEARQDESFGISEPPLQSESTLWKLYHEKKRFEAPQKEYKASQDESSGISERPQYSESTLWNLYKEQGNKGSKGKFEKLENFKYHNKNYGIFKADQTAEPKVAELSTWAELEKKELKSLLYHPPQNYFQEMIQWTEQGKVWRFPIDNEQGMEEEQNIHFSEHVFMERHLKGWCPKKGPIRHFMELVCVGLSKNPYMTVQEKVEHIMWYKDYFGDKRELLTELGAIENEDSSILPKPTNKIDLGPHV